MVHILKSTIFAFERLKETRVMEDAAAATAIAVCGCVPLQIE